MPVQLCKPTPHYHVWIESDDGEQLTRLPTAYRTRSTATYHLHQMGIMRGRRRSVLACAKECDGA